MENEVTTVRCLILLQSAYPRTEFGAESVKIYRTTLADIEPALLQTAVLKHISSSKWFPTIAELRKAATEIVLHSDGQLSAPEAWGKVMREVRSVGHWGSPSLGPVVMQAVEAIGGWRNVCLSENITADRARFIEAYTILRKREVMRVQQIPAVREGQEALAEGRKKVEEGVVGVLEGMKRTANSQQITVNGKRKTGWSG